MPSHLAHLEPSNRDKCLCGSNKKFKNCCKNDYPNKRFNGTQLYNKGEFRKALKATRAHITWYRLSHKAHTIPFLQSKTKESREWLQMDIRALSELLDLLLSCYRQCELINDYPHVLKEMESAIDDEEWKSKIDFNTCAYLCFHKNDKAAAKAIIKKYDWKELSDSDSLTIFLDINRDTLNHVQMIEISEKIVNSTKSPAEKFSYTCLIGMQYCLLDDIPKGAPILESAIKQFEAIPSEKCSLFGKSRLPLAYRHLGELTNNDEHIKAALELYTTETENHEYSTLGLAQTWCDVADCHYQLGNFGDSEAAYVKSLTLKQSGLTEVFYARVLIKINNSEEARSLLQAIKVKGFSKENYFDLAISLCELAIKTQLSTDIDEGLRAIKSVESKDPLLMKTIPDLLVQLFELKQQSPNTEKIESTLQKLNRYVSLKPNVFGIGLDINEILDDFLQ